MNNNAKKQRKILVNIVITFLFVLTGFTTSAQKNGHTSADKLKTHIEYLADDELKGRYPGDEGGILSSEYIYKQLSNYQLTPIAENGYQKFKVVTSVELGTNNQLLVNNNEALVKTDFMPVSFTENKTADGKVCFIDYGFDIDLDSLKWNSYKNIDANGKWVLMLTSDPEPDNMVSEFIPYASTRAKVTLAKDKGAVGVLLVNGTQTKKKDVLPELGFDQNMSRAGIPVFYISRKTANKILSGLATIEELESNILDQNTPIHLNTNTRVKGKAEVIQKKAEARNVVFELKAKKHTNKYIVIGAHYDHLGMGGENVSSRTPDTIAPHNGADDNASGVAGIIELANILQTNTETLNSNVIFVAFDAEEMGTLGSKHFVQNSPIPIENIKLMVNFDMIGRMKHDTIGITIGGTGTAHEFDSVLNINKPYFNTNFSPDGYGPSDHAPFYSADIPVLFITTGAHSDYHTPFDDIEKLKLDKQTDIVNYSAELILKLDALESGLTFQSTGSSNKGTRRTRLKVTFGIIPDVAGVVKDGLGIDGVRNGGPADKGGIKKGDKITAINGEPVTNIYDYMFRLSKLKPQSTAIVEIMRNGTKEVLLIQL